MRYVQGDRKDKGCIFCLAAESGDDEARLVLHRGERCLVMLNAFPYNSGHLMVSPHRHVASIEDLDEVELLELLTLTRRALRAVRETYGPDLARVWQTPAPQTLDADLEAFTGDMSDPFA